MTSLLEYQTAALQTAMPEAFRHDYLVPSIVGEVGELFGKRGKAVRDHWTEERLRRELAAEYGDVAWMVAVLLQMEGITEVPSRRLSGHEDPWYDILDLSQWLYEEHFDRARSLRDPAVQLWRSLACNCQCITGYSWDHVLAGNIKKLADRQRRGVLTGSGDNR